ncbi:MAG: hypothetical protein RIE53_04360 [Rhodothermales bacterium]
MARVPGASAYAFERGRACVLASLLFVFMAGCDTAPGPVDVSERPPVVSEFAVEPGVLIPDGTAGAGAAIEADVQVSWSVSDPDGDVDRVFVLIQSPNPGGAPVGSAEVSGVSGRMQTTVRVSIPAGAVGMYPVTVVASDRRGTMSNRLIGRLDVEGSGSPPVILDVVAPERVVRPAAGEPPVPITLVAHVSDPDGAANIARVQVVANGTATLLLCDDGGQGTCNGGFGSSGDETAGDARYTLTIQLTSGNAPGTNVFVFQARDRSGLDSGTVERTIIVE